ncbi:unnamed protein product [Caenorhabditis nigoni]
MGDTKTQVNIQQAYTILNCCGRNVTSQHLQEQWKFLGEKISVGRLYDIYRKADEVEVDDIGFAKAVKTSTIKIDDILNAVKDGSLVDKQYLEIVLQEFKTEDGFVDIGALLNTAAKSKVEVVNRLLGSGRPKVEEDETYEMKVRGCMTIHPKVQCISYTLEVEHPTLCELILCLAENSDVPSERFNNDLFLVVYNRDNKLIGLTQHVLENRKYRTGVMTINPGDEVMIFGMGTTMNRKRSTTEIRATLIEENNKLSKRFKYTLMNIFDSFDVDLDGLLNKQEMNFYTVASGDSELTDQDWEVYLNSFENRDGGLTMKGFIKSHEVEANDPEGNAVADLWHSLHCLGYDTQLSSIYGCSYDIECHTSRPVRMNPRLQYVVKEHRAFILENLYYLGEEDDRFEIRPRLFKTEYFGLLIARREEKYAKETYRIQLSSREHLKINFPHQVDHIIRFADSDSEWVLIASYTVTDPDAQLEYNLEKVQKSASNSTSPSLLRA